MSDRVRSRCLQALLRLAGCLPRVESGQPRNSLTASQCSGNGVGACFQTHCKITGSRSRGGPPTATGGVQDGIRQRGAHKFPVNEKGLKACVQVLERPGYVRGVQTMGVILWAGLVAMTAGGARLMRYQLGSRRNLSGRCNRKAAVWRDAADLDKQSGGT